MSVVVGFFLLGGGVGGKAGPYPMVLRADSLLCAEGTLLKGFRESYGVVGIGLGLTVCKAIASFSVLSLWLLKNDF